METMVQVGLVLGLAAHPQTVVDDLWAQARELLRSEGMGLCLTVLYIDDGSENVVPPDPSVTLVGLRLKPKSPIAEMAERNSQGPGLRGIAGRLLRDNLYSRSVAKAVHSTTKGLSLLIPSHLVVSADPAADRAVWSLRKRSSAKLMHGPIAMMNALAELSVQELPE